MKKRSKWSNTLLWTCGSLSGPVVYLLTAQLSYALTESFSVSAIYVGMVFMVSRLFDGVTDFIAGTIIDRTHSKLGKARFYDLFMVVAWVFVVFCFSVPSGLSEIGKVAFIFVMYNMYTSVFATFANVADTLRLKRTLDDDGRIHAVSFSGVVISLLSAAVSIVLPILISIFADQPGGWTRIALYFAVPCALLTVVRFLFLPEAEPEKEEESKKAVSVWEGTKMVLCDKYALIVMLVGGLQTFGATTASSMSVYYFDYVYGDVAAAAIPGMVSIIVLLGIAFMPVLVEKWGKSKAIMYPLLLAIAGSLLRYLMPLNLVWYTICSALSGLGSLPMAYLTQLMLIDVMNHARWKNGSSPEGVYSAVRNIASKIGAGIGAGLMGMILQMGALPGGGYTQGSIKFLNNAFSAIGWLIAVAALLFYDLDKKMPQINKELEERDARGTETSDAE